MMKYLLILAPLLLASPAKAAVDCTDAGTPERCNCIGVVYEVDSTTVDWFLIPWSEGDNIRELLRVGGGPPKNLAHLGVYYRQFGIQGGPSTFTGHDERHSVSYIPANGSEPRERLLVNEYFPSGSAPTDTSSENWFVAPLDDTEDVGVPFTLDTGRLAFQFLLGGRTGAILGVTSGDLASQGFDLLGRDPALGEVWAEILANGCP